MSKAPYKWNKYTSKSTVTYKWDKCYPYKRTVDTGSWVTELITPSHYAFTVYVYNREPTPTNSGTLVSPSYGYPLFGNGADEVLRYDYDLRENYWYCEEVDYGLEYLIGKWNVISSKQCGKYVQFTYKSSTSIEYIADRVTIDSGKKGDRIQTVFSEVSTAYPDNAISSSDGYWYTKTGSSTDYSQGDFVGTVSSDNPDAYPKNGRHKDGYWYVLI